MGDWGWHSACRITLPCNLLSTISLFYRSLSCLLRSFLLIYTGFQEVLEERNKASLNCLFSLLQMVWYLATGFKHLLLLKLYRLSTRNSLLHSANIVSSFSVNVNTVEFSILVPKLSITSCSIIIVPQNSTGQDFHLFELGVRKVIFPHISNFWNKIWVRMYWLEVCVWVERDRNAVSFEGNLN